MASDRELSRRNFLRVAGLAVAGSVLASADGPAASDQAQHPHAHAPESKEALDKLRSGNTRFSTLQLHHEDLLEDRRDAVEHGSHAYAAVLCCSDTRVSPEIVFDEGLNDLFVVRVAGNVATSGALGSLEYSIRELGVNLVMVLGHEDCGAVKAALRTDGHAAASEDYLDALIRPISPAILRAKQLPGDLLENAVRENVRLMMDKVRSAPFVTGAGRPIAIAGGIYRLKTGTVEFLET
nr:twin-arginine translocation signal domain-containing protein [Nitrospirota bacterium]